MSAPPPWQLFAPHVAAAFPFFLDRGGSDAPSFAGSAPFEQLVIDRRGTARTWRDGTWHDESRDSRDPVAVIESFVGHHHRRVAYELPDWLAGSALPRVVGYLSYELGDWTDSSHSLAARAQCDSGVPLAVLSAYDEIDAWNPSRAEAAHVRLREPARKQSPPPLAPAATGGWIPTPRDEYHRAFERIHTAIGDGEIYQANLSRRAVFPHAAAPSATYAALRDVQPVPWGAFLDFGGFAVLSNSPECFLMRSGDEIRTKPIKGTRPRAADALDDETCRKSLVSDPKEFAEHLMIVDLERNDLGRVARTGSVRVNRLANVETYATVHHMVSDVEARLRPATGLASLLRATFPGGSITGAPKIRAMEILREVETSERGVYTGAIGFFDGGDELELSIAIRTAVTSGGLLLYSTGGGIVADSDPDREWDETEVKLAALRAALPQEAVRSAANEEGEES